MFIYLLCLVTSQSKFQGDWHMDGVLVKLRVFGRECMGCIYRTEVKFIYLPPAKVCRAKVDKVLK